MINTFKFEIRVLIDDTEEGKGIKTELEKAKKQRAYSKEEISEMVETPSKFWNTDLLDLDDFGKSVAKSGIYKPKFYPFISPYKSELIPGIAIENLVNGTRLVSIENNDELEDIKKLFETAKSKKESEIGFNVIVMSPIAAGFGLNITGANHVIHYTRHWNLAKENQATDRAYRIEQTKPAHVYYQMAIVPNEELKTFDIILNKLLENKSQLASNTLFPSQQIEIKNDEFLDAFKISD